MPSADRKSQFALWCLMLAAFSIGVGEFVIMGLLPTIAVDLGVSLPAAGWLVTGYALGVAIGGPIIAITTLGVARRKLLLILLILFGVGTLLCAWGPTYEILMAGRVLGAVAHGAFVGAAAVVATRLVPREKEGSAVATVIGGFTVATVIGVPLGTWVGQALGWRSVFVIILALTAVAYAGLQLLLQQENRSSASDGPELAAELGALKRPQVLLALATTAFGFGGLFAAYTFIAAFLVDITGFSEAAVAPLLFLFGVGAVVGNIVGGRAANKALMPSIIVLLACLALALIALPMVAGMKWAVAAVLFVMGAAAFGATPGFQLRVVDKARDAPFLSSTLNITAFNLGNALGAFAGGLVVASSYGLVATGWAGAAIVGFGLAAAMASLVLDRRANSGRVNRNFRRE